MPVLGRYKHAVGMPMYMSLYAKTKHSFLSIFSCQQHAFVVASCLCVMVYMSFEYSMIDTLSNFYLLVMTFFYICCLRTNIQNIS